MLVTVAMSSCQSSVKSDAKKVADLYCKAQKMMEKANGEESKIFNAKEMHMKAEKMEAEMMQKYSKDDNIGISGFMAELKEARNNCE